MKGIGGGFGIMDILFSLRASVGLIVRAPKPVAWAVPGIIEILLLDEGVVVLCNLGLAGDWPVPTGEWNGCSGVPIGVENRSVSEKVFGCGCNDFVLACRVDKSK